MLEGRDALRVWVFVPPSRDQLHYFVRTRFTSATDADMKQIGYALDRLSRFRNQADYNVGILLAFLKAAPTQAAVQDAADALARLDAIQADAARRAGVAADLRARWP
jgi:hypothetical protein